ncbi:MAG: hypothetical protein HC896_14495 [Bacteroidales bacterium]|nr:hypothetical protein [Bacteroidales bacterium]
MWKFMWAERPDLVPPSFYSPTYSTNHWDTIKVPANWQMEGYGHPKFRNIALTFENNPPHVPYYYNPTGCYKRKFTVPDSWKQKEVMLRFEGIKSASYVWVNGHRVGYHQGGFEPAEYNITAYVLPGQNDLAVQVMRFCDGSYLENQDMWRLSGIYRDVKLVALPKVHVQDFYYATDLDKDYKNATLRVELNVLNKTGQAQPDHTLEVDVLDKQNESILSKKITAKFDINANASQQVQLNAEVENPLKWSAEFPNLYVITFELKDSNGNTLEAFTKKIRL